MFLVTVEGIYRHEVLGIFSTQQRAERVALLYVLKEKDGYHDLWISKMDLDVEVENIEPIFSFVTRDRKVDYDKKKQTRRIVQKFSEQYEVTLLKMEDEDIR